MSRMIDEMKKGIEMEVRPVSRGNEYLEAVVDRRDLGSLYSILKKYLGPPVKEAGREVELPPEIQRKVDSIGGIRIEQSFFYRREGNVIAYAALWPWASDPEKVTLKSGIEPV